MPSRQNGVLSAVADAAPLPDRIRDAGARERWMRRLRAGGRASVAVALLLGIGIAATTGLLVTHLRQQALHNAEQDLDRLALVLAHQAERTIQAVELVQDSLLDRLKGVATHEQYRAAMVGHAMHLDLQARIRGLPQISAVTSIDAEGKLLNFSRYWPIPEVNVSDRDYFIALKADPAMTVFVSEPVRNRGTGTWTVYVARKVAAPDGAFLGLILGALDLGYFERLYYEMDDGTQRSVSLFRLDGVLLARHPHLAEGAGRSFGGAAELRRLQLGGPTTILRRPADGTGEEELVAVHRLTRFGLAVAIGMPAASALEDWRQQTAYLLVGTLMLELVIAGICLQGMRYLRSQALLMDAVTGRAEAEAELALAEERERAQARARIQEARYGLALRTMTQGVNMFDADGRLVVVNPRYEAMFGIEPGAAAIGMHFDEVVALALGRSISTPEALGAAKATIRGYIAGGREVSYLREMEDGRSLAATIVPMEGGGWLATYEDITERRKAEAQIAYLAKHDALTGLPNRLLFRERLDEALARSGRGEDFAVLCLDLDHFKTVNDTLGHQIGDRLLREVTGRLMANVRETDTVARLGGDEFAIIQSGIDQPQDATDLSLRLVEALGAPCEIDGHSIIIGVSIGIAMLPGDGADADTLLRNADLALYRSKADGRSTYRYFEPHMDEQMQARRALELDLRKALPAGQFELFYQPCISTRTREVTGFEALLRWRHPERGLVNPASFIPLAEEIGLIVPIGEWVLRAACAEAATWSRDLTVSVNISSVQFGGPGPVPAVAAALEASGLDPARLELEITETVMLDDTAATLQTLQALKALGVRIAMDDFGTGYSSLSYLRQFPFDRVKIDKSFISNSEDAADGAMIVEAVTTLCRSLGMATTVEGVETEAQLRTLMLGNSTNVQGYLFSKPRPASEVEQMCRSLDRAVAAQDAARRTGAAAGRLPADGILAAADAR